MGKDYLTPMKGYLGADFGNTVERLIFPTWL